MPATPQSRRLGVVQKDFQGSVPAFAKMIGVSVRSVQRMIIGEQEINYTVISAVCLKLGYSPEWFILGTGNKKLKGDEGKLVTEIQMLRAEIDITANLNLRLQARLTGVEHEHGELKADMEQIRQSIKK